MKRLREDVEKHTPEVEWELLWLPLPRYSRVRARLLYYEERADSLQYTEGLLGELPAEHPEGEVERGQHVC